ncbi:MAG TPA: hypothetical protein VF116_19550 [Ktedonobacterales bacterium]
MPCEDEVLRVSAGIALRLFELKRASRRRTIMDDTKLLEHCAALAAEHRVVKEMRELPESFCWRLLRVRLMQQACRWKHYTPGQPSRAAILNGDWYAIVLSGIAEPSRSRIHDAATTAYAHAEKGICDIKRKGRFKGRSRLDTWCLTIVRNILIEHHWAEEQGGDRVVPLDDRERAGGGEDADSDTQVPIPAPDHVTEREVLDGEAVRLAESAIAKWAARTASSPEQERLSVEILCKVCIEERKPGNVTAEYGPPIDAKWISQRKWIFKKSPEGQRLYAELRARQLMSPQPEVRAVTASGEAT